MAEDLGPSAGNIRVKITCPTGIVADMEAVSAEVPAVCAPRLMMPQTAPLLCLLTQGKVIIHKEKGDIVYYISQGVCEMRRGICAIMAWGVDSDKINRERWEKLLQESETVLPTLTSQSSKRELSDRIAFYRTVLQK